MAEDRFRPKDEDEDEEDEIDDTVNDHVPAW